MKVGGMEIQLTMLGVVVQDMPTALRFYRLLGLDIPDHEDEKKFVPHRMRSSVTIFFDTVFAARYNSAYVAAADHKFRTMCEFYL